MLELCKVSAKDDLLMVIFLIHVTLKLLYKTKLLHDT